MDLSAFIVAVVLIVLGFGAIVWLEIYARRAQPKEESADQSGSGIKRNNRFKSISRDFTNRVDS